MLLPGRRLLFLLHLGIGSLDTGVGQEEVFGVDGSSPLLDPKIGADLSKSDVVWEFTGSDRRLLTILDYVPNYSKLEPNEQFKLRLRFNVSTGSLRIINATSRDQGVYKITVDGKLRGSRVLKLIGQECEPAASVQMIVIPVVVVLLLLLAVVIFFLMVCRKYKKKGQLDLQQYIPVHKIMNFNFMS
ncbi:uncharacterized protein LOC121291660 isoform X2 [Carcharodon carcharias]|uniref:uncharacterized protein LOC121291660 isoform X2 n=1 Tax=Carcharodon carcharias TaxID=13397 RepID=UPI001B7F758A|nr:uncharacterized protein LOC121291660 isoform X2 [Carcharodon carcharias]